MPISYTKPPPKKAPSPLANAPGDEYENLLVSKGGSAVSEVQPFHKSKPSGPKQSKSEALTLPDHGLVSLPMTLRFGVGRTINIGDYESIRLYVGLDMPTSKETLKKDWDWITNETGDRLAECEKAARS